MTVQAELLSEVNTYIARRGNMAGTSFGLYAVNDGKFYRRLEAGGNMTLATVDRVRAYMRNNPPSDTQDVSDGATTRAA